MVRARYPRNRPAVVKTNRKVHLHRHLAAHPAHHPHQMRMLLPRRHKVHKADLAVLCLKSRLDYQHVRLVPSPHRLHFPGRGNLPISVVARTQQRSKTRRRRKIRPAQPVDRTITRHQSRRLAVSNHAIIFNQRAVQRSRAFLLLLDHCFSPSLAAFLLPATAYAKERICLRAAPNT